jgi:hypothetical protein
MEKGKGQRVQKEGRPSGRGQRTCVHMWSCSSMRAESSGFWKGLCTYASSKAERDETEQGTTRRKTDRGR